MAEGGRSTYLGSCILCGDRISDEVSSRMKKDRLAFVNLRKFLREHDTTVVKSILACGPETWPLRANEQRLSVSEYCYPSNIDRIWWEDFVSNSVFRRKVVGLK